MRALRQRAGRVVDPRPPRDGGLGALDIAGRKRRSRGQSIVELVIILPVLLLMVMVALDMGRLFMGWVVLNNAARVGSNYAALYPDAWGSPGNATQQVRYADLLTDARNDSAIALAGCDTAAVPAPAFPTGKDVGDYAEVILDCDFTPLTPIIGDVFASTGNKLGVTARSVFPIRTGVIAGAAITPPPSCLAAITPPPSCLADFTWAIDPGDSLRVNFNDATPPIASGWIWSFGDGNTATTQSPSHTYSSGGTYTVELQVNSNGTQCTPLPEDITVVEPPPTPDPSASPGPSPSAVPSPTAVPPCVVPSFIGEKRRDAQDIWDAANFTTTVLLDPDASTTANWTIQSQSLVGGQDAPCNASITISPDTPAP